MDRDYRVEIPQFLIHYDPKELRQWKSADPAVVPSDVLDWKGPGLSGGYGYSEFVSERQLRSRSFEVLNTNYDLFAEKSKYGANNRRVEAVSGTWGMPGYAMAFARCDKPGIASSSPTSLFMRRTKLSSLRPRRTRTSSGRRRACLASRHGRGPVIDWDRVAI